MAAWVRKYGPIAAMSVSTGCFAWLSAGTAMMSIANGERRELSAMLAFLCAVCMAGAALAGAALLAQHGSWRAAFRCGAAKKLCLSALAAYTAVRYVWYMSCFVPGPYAFECYDLLTIGAAPALYLFFYFAYRELGRLSGAISGGAGRPARHEAVFFVLAVFAGTAAMAAAFREMPALYRGRSYGVVYTFDSQTHVLSDVFFIIDTPDNDLRNPFFGLFSLPLAAPAHVLSDLVRIALKIDIYPFLIGMLQVAAVSAVIILFARLACRHAAGQVGIYILFSGCYIFLLNIFIIEQYAFSIFWLAAAIYIMCRGPDDSLPAACLGAAGCLSSSILVLGPYAIERRRAAVPAVRDIMVRGAAVLCLSGQAIRLVASLYGFGCSYGIFFGGGSGLLHRFVLFSEAVSAVFLQPAAMIADIGPAGGPALYAYVSSDEHALSLFGCAVMAVLAASAALNRRDAFCRICAWWAGMSFLILCAAGWGVSENGMVIYMAYFGWAYVCLAFKLLERALAKYPAAVPAACACAAGLLLSVNIPGLEGLFDFLREYYPA